MKIFIWNDPYDVPYGGSFLFVAAETVEQARELAPKMATLRHGYGPVRRYRPGEVEIPGRVVGQLLRLGDAIDLGEPSMVIDAPGEGCHEWQE